MLRQIWKDKNILNWRSGLFLIFLFGIPRFILVLQANMTGNYNLIPLIFVMMMLSPMLLLSKEGRKEIGMRKPSNTVWLLLSLILGIGACFLCFQLASYLFNYSVENPFAYISKTYKVPSLLSDLDRLIYFIIYALIGMTFSPIGEELFYRGIVHAGFAAHLGEHKASMIDSGAFALTHLAHFGIVYLAGSWQFLFGPALNWVLMMYLVSRLFFFCKQRSGSVLGAILCHAGFNLGMMYLIFYKIF